MANDSTRKALTSDIINLRAKIKFYESLRLFEAVKYAESLAAKLEQALTTLPADAEHQPLRTPPATVHEGPAPIPAKKIVWPVIRTQMELSQAAEKLRAGGRIYEQQGKKIGEVLNILQVIDDKTLHAVEQHHQTKKANGKPIGQLLIHMGIIEPEVLARALCIQTGVPMVELPSMNIPLDVLKRIPNDQGRAKNVVPVGMYNNTLYLSVADPATFSDQQHFAFLAKLNIKPVFSPLHEIMTFINTKWVGADADMWAG